MSKEFEENLTRVNFLNLLAVTHQLSRPGVYSQVTFNILDGAVGEHVEVNFKVKPPRDALRKREVMKALEELAGWTKETVA